MKKFVCVVMALCLTFCATITGFAQYIDSEEYGISFSLSDNWVWENSDDSINFWYNGSSSENVQIAKVDADWAWSMEFADGAKLRSLCEDIYSDANLSDSLSSKNNAYVTVNTEYVNEDYVTYNGIKYYKYEKVYMAKAYGFYDTRFYETVFVTPKNGKAYFIYYCREEGENHFADVVAMLNGMSYDNGEIKIRVDGERIYPDSAPMIIDGRTLVPIRAIAEKMGYSVSWDGVAQIVTLVSDDTILNFGIGFDTALKNLSEEIELDVPAIIAEGRTYLPVRAVAEAMDADVQWNGAQRTVEIWQ